MKTCNTDLFKNTCALTVTFRQWGNRRKGNLAQVDTDADKSRLKLTKELITAKEYDEIQTFLNETRGWIMSRTMPFLGFKKGIYLAKVDFVPEVEKELPKRIETLTAMIDRLVYVFPEKVNEAREKLNGQFDYKDYPKAEDLYSYFGIEWNWIAFQVPENLPAELRAAEEKKLAAKFEECEQEITLALREGFKQLMDHCVEKLKVEPNGKPKIFRDSLIGNVLEFIDTFKARNLTNDADLEILVDKAKSLVQGIKPEDLRKDMTLRDKMAKQFKEVQGELDKMIVEMPSRKFKFDEE